MEKKTTRARRNYTPEFKKDAVRLLRSGRSVTDVADSLGVARSLLQRWRKQIGASADEASPCLESLILRSQRRVMSPSV
ncbi:MAG TPA: hypothetical protein EYQ60_17215 [Myxococcales bacterium]|nr:hypothetical protein [Myxococcales bacterium]